MDMLDFYTGKVFNAYDFFGAHLGKNGTTFRVFAPNAVKVSIIGDFSHWKDIPMNKIYDGNFYECLIENAKIGMRYKIRVYEKNGRYLDHCDPYGYGMELRPQNASIIRDLSSYTFHDKGWLKERTDHKDKPLNIYEVHLGSWKKNEKDENNECFYSYRELAELLIPYVKKHHYNYIEVLPLCEYPCDESWGYQALGYFSPTSRYGDLDGLKYLIDTCHQNAIGIILDFVTVHFALDDFGLGNFDGNPLYEYPHSDIGYNQWGSKNFAHSRGEVRSFLQSSVNYWLKEYHFDGIRFDAISNMIYWQGDCERGINKNAISFLQFMNRELKHMYPDVMLIAEDSTAFPNVTKDVASNGLGFDYKWDMGWMNDTLKYFNEHPYDRSRDYHKLTFSMHYYYSDFFLLPLSHDEVVHGKGTVIDKINGSYEDKFFQVRAFYMYMYAHPGKKLNFMGNEIAQFREWDEKKELDWKLLDDKRHNLFHNYIIELNELYLNNSALYEKDYKKEGFLWLDKESCDSCIYAFQRTSETQNILAVFNFSNIKKNQYALKLEGFNKVRLIMDSTYKRFGGNNSSRKKIFSISEQHLVIDLEPFSAKYYLME